MTWGIMALGAALSDSGSGNQMNTQNSVGGIVRNLWQAGIVSGLVILASASSATAASIALPSTGVNGLGVVLAQGSIDPHWSIVAGPAVPVIPFPVSGIVVSDANISGGGYAVSSESQWIWPYETGNAATTDPYTFRLTFDLTGYDVGLASLAGFWGTDNNGSIRMNGVDAVGSGELSLSGGGLENFQSFHAFLITSGFVAGVNTLDFLVVDDENPGGLNVFDLNVMDLEAAAVPEPSSLALSAIGLAIGVQLLRRRTR
jgi:hypothetical protein